MTFIPYRDKIEIKPLEKEEPFSYDEKKYHEAGTVVAVGEDVTDVKVGDTIFFLGYGCWETIEFEGEKHWVVPQRTEFILGTYTP